MHIYNAKNYDGNISARYNGNRNRGRSTQVTAGGYVGASGKAVGQNSQGFYLERNILETDFTKANRMHYNQDNAYASSNGVRYEGRSVSSVGGYIGGSERVNLKWVGGYWHRSIVRSIQDRKAYRLYFLDSTVEAATASTCYVGRSVGSTIRWLR